MLLWVFNIAGDVNIFLGGVMYFLFIAGIKLPPQQCCDGILNLNVTGGSSSILGYFCFYGFADNWVSVITQPCSHTVM